MILVVKVQCFCEMIPHPLAFRGRVCLRAHVLIEVKGSPSLLSPPLLYCNTFYRTTDLLSVRTARAGRVLTDKDKRPAFPVKEFRVGGMVWVSQGTSLLQKVKFLSFQSPYQVPCTVVRANNPIYAFLSGLGCHTRMSVHSLRLMGYFKRPAYLNYHVNLSCKRDRGNYLF